MYTKSTNYCTIVVIFLFIGIIALVAIKVNAKTVTFGITQVALPKYFTPGQWTNDDRIFGLAGDKFIELNPATGNWNVVHPHIWAGVVDSKGKVLAFQNENGLSYLQMNQHKTVIPINSNPDSKPHFWSPDGRYLLYSLNEKWTAHYWIYDREMEQSLPFEFKNVENYLSEPLGWVESAGKSELIFCLHFSKSRIGQSEYRKAGYRSELYKANLAGEFTPLVQMADGQFVIFDGFSANNQIGYYHVYGDETQIQEFDLQTGSTGKHLSFPESKKISISARQEVALVVKNYLQFVSLKDQNPLYTWTFEFKRFLWSPDQTKAFIFPSINSEVTRGYLLQL